MRVPTRIRRLVELKQREETCWLEDDVAGDGRPGLPVFHLASVPSKDKAYRQKTQKQTFTQKNETALWVKTHYPLKSPG